MGGGHPTKNAIGYNTVVITQEEIQKVAQRIAEEFRPERVILFGSYAYGTPNADSDVDILVVMPHEGKTFHKAAEIQTRIRPSFPMDILVRAPDVLEQRIALGDFFLREIVQKGKILYRAEAPNKIL